MVRTGGMAARDVRIDGYEQVRVLCMRILGHSATSYSCGAEASGRSPARAPASEKLGVHPNALLQNRFLATRPRPAL